MTEADWRFALSPISPLEWLFFDTPVADRKLRLFSVACCRRFKHLIPGESLLRLLDKSEAFAEGQIAEVTLRSAHREDVQKYQGLVGAGKGLSSEASAAGLASLYASSDVERERDRRRYSRDDTPNCVR